MNTTDRNALICTTWSRVHGQAESFSTTFYDTLFSLDPALRPLFRDDMTAQRERLVAMIDTAVRLLDQPDTLMPALRTLGKRHAGYGVRDEHYDVVCAALLHSLAEILRDEFTPAMRSAWIETLDTICCTMKEAARPAAKSMTLARMPAVAALAALVMTMAAGSAMACEPGPFGLHPALSSPCSTATVAAQPGIDPNTFIVGHPASPTTRGGHANFEHPAVLTARAAARPVIDSNTFIVQPPAMATWRVEPDDYAGARYAQSPTGAATKSR